MSEMITLDSGELMDAETGEVLEIPEGADRAQWLAAEYATACEQERAWAARKGMLAAAYMAVVPERRCAYPEVGVVLSVRSSMRRVQDTAAIRAILAECELTYDDAVRTAAAAKGWDVDLLPAAVRAIVEEHTQEQPTRAWLALDRIRKPAPQTTRRPVEVTS